jgi:Ser/Thr protein kinase RdoA (MazF antagonist)
MKPAQLINPLWHQVCKLYELPQDAKTELLNSSQPQVYKISFQDGPTQVLRIYPPGVETNEAICTEMRLLTYLSQKTDLKIPIPITNVEGQFITVVHEEDNSDPIQLVMLTYVDGEVIHGNITAEMMFQIGQILGHLDLALQKADAFIDPSPSQRKKAYEEQELIGFPLLELKKNGLNLRLPFAGGNIELMEKVADRLRRNYNNVKDFLPSQLLHTDAHFNNLVFDGTRIGILDFTNFRYGPRIYELTAPLHCIDDLAAAIEPINLSSSEAQLTESLLAGYMDFIALSNLELKALPLFQAIRLFDILSWLVSQPDTEDWVAQNGRGVVMRIVHLLNEYEQDTGLDLKSILKYFPKLITRVGQWVCRLTK